MKRIFKGKDLCEFLVSKGGQARSGKGDHIIIRIDNKTLSIPGGLQEIPLGYVKKILKRANLLYLLGRE